MVLAYPCQNNTEINLTNGLGHGTLIIRSETGEQIMTNPCVYKHCPKHDSVHIKRVGCFECHLEIREIGLGLDKDGNLEYSIDIEYKSKGGTDNDIQNMYRK